MDLPPTVTEVVMLLLLHILYTKTKGEALPSFPGGVIADIHVSQSRDGPCGDVMWGFAV